MTMLSRRTAAMSAAVALATLGVAAPADAATTAPGSGWVHVTYNPFDVAAGARCDFPIHGEPIVNEVYAKTTRTYADGTPEQIVYAGPLVFRVTDTDNGRSYDANASGTAVVNYGADGSQTWEVIGPVLLGSKDGQSNLGRGEWLVNGVYQVAFTPARQYTVTFATGRAQNVCDEIG